MEVDKNLNLLILFQIPIGVSLGMGFINMYDFSNYHLCVLNLLTPGLGFCMPKNPLCDTVEQLGLNPTVLK